MHSKKLQLWKWLLAMYYMVHSSIGISSVFMAKWVGVTQKTAWKMCHAIRYMLERTAKGTPPLFGVVKLDEKYFGGKPRHKVGVRIKRGKASNKQCVFVALQRKGPVRSALVNDFVRPDAYLMTDPFVSQDWSRICRAFLGQSQYGGIFPRRC